ncbi:hypothetical protein NQZ68_019146 [Dissostichus eleginoides]|nr:hypothetical protein NQZ68_019146 [Dissostichus eleginoides]
MWHLLPVEIFEHRLAFSQTAPLLEAVVYLLSGATCPPPPTEQREHLQPPETWPPGVSPRKDMQTKKQFRDPDVRRKQLPEEWCLLQMGQRNNSSSQERCTLCRHCLRAKGWLWTSAALRQRPVNIRPVYPY